MLKSKVLASLLLFILRLFLVQLIVAVSSSPSEFLVFIWFICSLQNYYSCSRDEACFKDAGILFGLNAFFVLLGFLVHLCGKVSANFNFAITSCMQLEKAGLFFFFP